MPTTTRTRVEKVPVVQAPAALPTPAEVVAATAKRGAESEIAAGAAKKPRAETPHDGNVVGRKPDDQRSSSAKSTYTKKITRWTWEELFFHFCLYKIQKGRVPTANKLTMDAAIPAVAGGPRRPTKVQLGKWIAEMRRHKEVLDEFAATDGDPSAEPSVHSAARSAAAAVLTDERLVVLDEHGFQWEGKSANELYEHSWEVKYQALVQFHAKEGHADPPNGHALYTWCSRQRLEESTISGRRTELGHTAQASMGSGEEQASSRRKKTSTKQSSLNRGIWSERKAKLDALDFVWIKRSRTNWEERLEQLKQYKLENGHTQVPQMYTANRQLGKWVNRQRTEYMLMTKGKKSCMTEERAEMLKGIGFEFFTKRGKPSYLGKLAEGKIEHVAEDGRDPILEQAADALVGEGDLAVEEGTTAVGEARLSMGEIPTGNVASTASVELPAVEHMEM